MVLGLRRMRCCTALFFPPLPQGSRFGGPAGVCVGLFLVPSGDAEEEAGRQICGEVRTFFERCVQDGALQGMPALR
jgi:hypothetical protein